MWRTVTRLQSIKCVRLLWLMHYEAIKNGNYSTHTGAPLPSSPASPLASAAARAHSREPDHIPCRLGRRVRTRCPSTRLVDTMRRRHARTGCKTHPDPSQFAAVDTRSIFGRDIFVRDNTFDFHYRVNFALTYTRDGSFSFWRIEGTFLNNTHFKFCGIFFFDSWNAI